MLAVLLGCRAPLVVHVPDGEGSYPPPVGEVSGLAPIPARSADVLEATCRVADDNALRATCALTLSDLAEAEVELTDGVEAVVFRTDRPSTGPDVAIWGLYPGSSWTWTARAGGVEVTGRLDVPDALPAELRLDPGRDFTGPSTLVQWLGALDCDGGGDVAVLDAEGRVRWYQDTGGIDVDMVRLTEAGTVLAIADKALLVEVDLTGQDRLRRDDLPFPIHHDATRRGDRIYVLSADAWPGDDGRDYVEDTVLALDGAGDEVWRWDEHDWLDTAKSRGVVNSFWGFAFPGAVDAWHTNGLHVTDGGDLLVSLYTEDTILRVSGSTGAIDWVLAGDGVGNVLPTTFPSMDDPARFGDQHHPALVDGRVTLFDNQDLRGLELEVDPADHSATLVADWPLPQPISCPVQSSVFPLPGGHHLVTCADRHLVTEFDRDGAPVGRFALTCPDGGEFPRIPRGQPVDLWDGISAAGATAHRID